MKAKTKALTAMLLLSMLCSACGGGGGESEGSDVPFYGGVYKVRLNTIENTCTFSIPPDDRTYTVNQDGSKVVADSNPGSTYEGTTTPNGFVASTTATGTCMSLATGEPIPGSVYQWTASVSFDFNGAAGPQVTFSEDIGNCSKNTRDTSCHFTMVGTARLDAT